MPNIDKDCTMVYKENQYLHTRNEMFNLGYNKAILNVLSFIKKERDNGNIERKGFSASICLFDLIKWLKKELGDNNQLNERGSKKK